MLAFLAAASFLVALILHIAGGHSGKYWLDFTLAAAVLACLHFAFGAWWPWGRPRP